MHPRGMALWQKEGDYSRCATSPRFRLDEIRLKWCIEENEDGKNIGL